MSAISVIVVTYRPGPELLSCLNSLEKFIDCEKEIIICDNSPEASYILANVESDFKNVKVIYIQNNPGFGTANNIGAANAVHKFLMFINPDAVLTSQVNNPSDLLTDGIGILSGYCLDEEYRYKQTVGHFPISPSLLILFSRRLNSTPPFDTGVFSHDFVEIDYAEGSLYLIRADIFKQVNGFDQDIFLYGEDYELSYRIHLAGYRNVIARDLTYQHVGGFNHSREPHIVNGLLHFAKKHLPFHKRLGVRSVLVARTVLLLIIHVVLGFANQRRRKRVRPLFLSLRRTLEA